MDELPAIAEVRAGLNARFSTDYGASDGELEQLIARAGAYSRALPSIVAMVGRWLAQR